ncbi:MAG: hypothetical protein QM820_61740 [Minicystis sp.]
MPAPPLLGVVVMMTAHVRSIPFAVVLASLAAACSGTVEQSLDSHDSSTLWMETIVVSVPNDPAPEASLLGQCLSRTPTLDLTTGVPACVVLEGRHGGGSCACDPAAARKPVDPAHTGAENMAKATSQAQDLALDCFCEVAMLAGAQRDACQNDTSDAVQVDGQPVDGVCYVDATLSPPLGNPQLIEKCPQTEKRLVRFVGQGAPAPTTGTVAEFIVCQQDQHDTP